MIRRGQIYFVDLNPTRGREQAGRRPALVVSSDTINRQALVITVVIGTKTENVTRDYATNVRVKAAETGLPQDTVFLCFQVRSLDPERFHDAAVAGEMPPARMREVERALQRVLELP